MVAFILDWDGWEEWEMGAAGGASRREAGLLYSISDKHGILVFLRGAEEGVRDGQMSPHGVTLGLDGMYPVYPSSNSPREREA